jgi:hypothetical protein
MKEQKKGEKGNKKENTATKTYQTIKTLTVTTNSKNVKKGKNYFFVFLTELTVNQEDGKIESFSNFVVNALFLKLS